MTDKIILVHYIKIQEGLSVNRAKETFYQYQDVIRQVDPEAIHYIIPTKTGESHIECINPKLITEADYIGIQDFMNITQKVVDEFFAQLQDVQPAEIVGEPKFPDNRYIKEGCTHFCAHCSSSVSKSGFLGLFGKLRCHNPNCKSNQPL